MKPFLTKHDHYLKEIYEHETLTLKHLAGLFGSDEEEQRELIQTMQQFKQEKLIKQVLKESNNPNYVLTDKGVQRVKHCLALSENKFSNTKQILHQGYIQASKLAPASNQFELQNELNELEIMIRKNLPTYYQGTYRYRDRKFFDPSLRFTGARGMFYLAGRSFLLHLFKETKSIEGFVNQIKTAYIHRKDEDLDVVLGDPLIQLLKGESTIVILTKTPESALKWRQKLQPLMEKITDRQIECFIGTKKEFLTYLFTDYLPCAQGLNQWMNQTFLHLKRLGCHLTDHPDLSIEEVNQYQGSLQTPLTQRSILMSFHHTNTQGALQNYFNHILRYHTFKATAYAEIFLIVVKDLELFKAELEQYNTLDSFGHQPLSFVTTPQLLAQATSMEEAVVQYSTAGWVVEQIPTHFL